MARRLGAIAVVCLHPGQAPDADDLRLDRVADVERPDHPVFPSLRRVRQERELALVVDAEAVRPIAGQIVKADLLWLAAFRDVENEKTGPGVAPRIPGKAFGIHVEEVAVDDAEL